MKPNAKAKSVANNIRRVREFRNYTQDYVARKIGISQNAYSKLELGFHKMSLERLFQIAEVLEIECAALLQHDSDGIVRLHLDPAVRQVTP
ncbi:helix-turn-helix domain-containing protein [Parapedobacter sp. GCM10030251]|uniref:helix-turn-helix domain-containing protein n=1 Tax=Parapedobacter sp. GCM10030251 TaxID=3273419 RepID=UPI00361034BE